MSFLYDDDEFVVEVELETSSTKKHRPLGKRFRIFSSCCPWFFFFFSSWMLFFRKSHSQLTIIDNKARIAEEVEIVKRSRVQNSKNSKNKKNLAKQREAVELTKWVFYILNEHVFLIVELRKLEPLLNSDVEFFCPSDMKLIIFLYHLRLFFQVVKGAM